MGYAFLAVIAVALVESIVSGFWAPFYFRWGIPLYRRTIPYVSSRRPELDAEALTGKFARRAVVSLVFQSLRPGYIAFRERIIQVTLIHYTPIMHGLIRLDDRDAAVTVVGHANIWPLCFAAVWVSFCFTEGMIAPARVLFLGILPLALGFCYAIQASRFSGVCREIERRLGA